MQEAVFEAKKFYKCNKKQLKVYIIEPPISKLLGFIKMPGKYKIELMDNENKSKVISEQKCVDGCIEIVSGNAKVTDPLNEGRYASIIVDDPNIDVYINGEKVFGSAIVTSSDRIEFKGMEIEPVTKIIARLSGDKMQAILGIKKIPGKKYFVKDHKPSNVIFIRSDYHEVQPPAATLEQCLEELIKLNVDPRFINIENINELINKESGGSAVVAKGIPPINGLNSKVKLFFKNTIYRNPDFYTEKRVDLMDHTIIPTVSVGDVLAVKTSPAIPGRDGYTVTGDLIKAKRGRDIPLRAGKGTTLLDNGTKVVAISPGRPKYEKGVISVIPTLVINHDLDISTGNIHFDGEIVIKGNITENLRVSAGGDITVFGNVYHANVYAKGDIKINGNIINSKILAGLNMILYLAIKPKLKQLLDMVIEFQNVEKAYEMPNTDASKHGVNINIRNVRRKLLQLVISKKDILDKLIKDIENLIKLSVHDNDEEISALISILENTKKILTGINANCIKDPQKIKTLYAEINDYINKIDEQYADQADVTFEYAQNSLIQSSGNIVVTNKGCYHTNLIAKNAIFFKKQTSIMRGGLLIAGNRIKLGIAGAPSGISTYCKVLHEDGKIDAAFCYSNTIINICGNVKTIDSDSYVENIQIGAK